MNNYTLHNPGFSTLTAGKHNTTAITACTGYNPAKLTFTTPVTGGTPPYSYQWLLNDEVIDGEILSSCDPPQLSEAGTFRYNCSVTDQDGSVVYTEPKVITIVPDPYVTITGGGETCLNGEIILTSTIFNGTGTYSYQWETGPSVMGPWSLLDGATFPDYTVAAYPAGSLFYRLLINPAVGSCNNAASDGESILVKTLPVTSSIYHL